MTNMAAEQRKQHKKGDIVWAKIRGFPPWPALIINSPESETTGRHPKGQGITTKYEVRFFGTGETAAVKPTELFDYFENRKLFGVERKQRGFNDALREAHMAAARLGAGGRFRRGSRKTSTDDGSSASSPTRSNNSPASTVHSTPPPRLRRVSHSSVESATTTTTTTQFHSFNGAAHRSRANSRGEQSTATLKSAVRAMVEQSTTLLVPSPERPKRVKRVSYSDKVDYQPTADEHQHSSASGGSTSSPAFALVTGALDPVLSTTADPLLSLFAAQHEHSLNTGSGSSTLLDAGDNMRRSGRRRRRSSRLFDDFLTVPATGHLRKDSHSPSTPRSRSISSGGRSRLVSVSGGLSDAFDELIEAAQLFNPNDLMAAIDQLPSEDDRPATPEEPPPMPAPLKKCDECGCLCELLNNTKWRCTSRACLRWNGTYQVSSFSPSSSPEAKIRQRLPSELSLSRYAFSKQQLGYPTSDEDEEKLLAKLLQPTAAALGTDPTRETMLPFGHTGIAVTKFQPASIAGNKRASGAFAIQDGGVFSTSKSKRKDREGRTRVYKVEKTPPMTANGRLCLLCNGQVRPQMCGGNKHRWRCVDKRCRKWYGWVRLNDEIPSDLGKKGRWKDLAIKVHNHEQQRKRRLGGDATADSADDDEQVPITGLTPKALLEGVMLPDEFLHGYGDGVLVEKPATTSHQQPRQRPKKYAHKRRMEEDIPQREVSPLSLLQQSYEPSKLEQRGRWWLSGGNAHARRQLNSVHSPERQITTAPFSSAAAIKAIGVAMNVAATTRADEGGSVNGTLDLLMDTMMSSMAPILSLVGEVPQTGGLSQTTTDSLFAASLPHTPIFQQ